MIKFFKFEQKIKGLQIFNIIILQKINYYHFK